MGRSSGREDNDYQTDGEYRLHLEWWTMELCAHAGTARPWGRICCFRMSYIATACGPVIMIIKRKKKPTKGTNTKVRLFINWVPTCAEHPSCCAAGWRTEPRLVASSFPVAVTQLYVTVRNVAFILDILYMLKTEDSSRKRHGRGKARLTGRTPPSGLGALCPHKNLSNKPSALFVKRSRESTHKHARFIDHQGIGCCGAAGTSRIFDG